MQAIYYFEKECNSQPQIILRQRPLGVGHIQFDTQKASKSSLLLISSSYQGKYPFFLRYDLWVTLWKLL